MASASYHRYFGVADVEPLCQRIAKRHPGGASLFDLAPLDQLHIGGLGASQRLIARLDPTTHPRLLDIGSGLGGLARVASLAGFAVVALDITAAFSRLSARLNALMAAPSAAFTPPQAVTGSALALPFAASTFDATVFQHSLLNVPDGQVALAECRRVLRPGGRLVLHEIVEGPHPETLRFPVPWSLDGQGSHLLTQETLEKMLTKSGFTLQRSSDLTPEALAWRRHQVQKEAQAAQETGVANRAEKLSPALVFGPCFADMGANLVANLQNGAIKVVEMELGC